MAVWLGAVRSGLARFLSTSLACIADISEVFAVSSGLPLHPADLTDAWWCELGEFSGGNRMACGWL